MSDERVRRGVEWFDANFNGIPDSEALVRGILEVARHSVKQLEWEELSPVGDMSAETSIGYYEIYFDDDEDVDKTPWCAWTLFENLGHFATMEEAKAAAQSDYERRILSALE